eukprot:XP_001706791.1 Hypothetical protein GL50803_5173 [Giardia lamblia ATCC 50803]
MTSDELASFTFSENGVASPITLKVSGSDITLQTIQTVRPRNTRLSPPAAMLRPTPLVAETHTLQNGTRAIIYFFVDSFEDVNFERALSASSRIRRPISPGMTSFAADSMSFFPIVFRLLIFARFDASDAMRSKRSFTSEFITSMPLFEIPRSVSASERMFSERRTL